MKKITQKTFLDVLTPTMKEFYEIDGVKSLDSKNVIEINMRGNFYYTLHPDSHLNTIQDNINEYLLKEIPLNNSCVAFRCGLSYLNFLQPHVGSFNYIRLDIKSFFHSIPYDLIRSVFSKYFENESIEIYNRQSLIDSFLKLITYKVPEDSLNLKFRGKDILPIGFKTSPIVSNVFFRELDLLIQKKCVNKGVSYTRYADDMLFSSPKNNSFIMSDSFVKDISVLISRFGFVLNKHKTLKSQHTLSLNGYTLSYSSPSSENPSMRISNKKTNKIEKIIHKVNKGETPILILSKLFGFRINSFNFKYLPPKADFVEQYCKDQLFNKIIGYRSYLISAIKFNFKYGCITKSSQVKYLKLISELDVIIERYR